MPVPITDAQLQQLRDEIDKLVANKTAADDATAKSNDAHHALAKAQADVAAADTAEAQADGLVSAGIQRIQTFIATLGGPPPEPKPMTGGRRHHEE
jgi:LDH2 family malate/lactate/ureidoglycolate dehydrogenase